jgi:hypothetical protein
VSLFSFKLGSIAMRPNLELNNFCTLDIALPAVVHAKLTTVAEDFQPYIFECGVLKQASLFLFDFKLHL